MAVNVPTPELLRKLLRYEPDTGKLFWCWRPIEMFTTGAHTAEHSQKVWNTARAGKEAFTANCAGGYRGGGIFGRLYLAHRVIWAIHTGAWPDEEIDHINHQKTDNRWANIRAVTNAENRKNRPMYSRNTSGICGVHWHKKSGKWRAVIKSDGEIMHLGLFVSLIDAAKARQAGEKKYGFHPNHGGAQCLKPTTQ